MIYLYLENHQYFNIVHFKGDIAHDNPTVFKGIQRKNIIQYACVLFTQAASYIGRLFTGAESERICVRKYDLVALRSFTNSSDLSGRRERPERTHSALFQLISCRNIVDLCECVCLRGWLRNNGNKNSVNLAKRYSRVSSIKYSAYVWPHFFSPSTTLTLMVVWDWLRCFIRTTLVNVVNIIRYTVRAKSIRTKEIFLWKKS